MQNSSAITKSFAIMVVMRQGYVVMRLLRISDTTSILSGEVRAGGTGLREAPALGEHGLAGSSGAG